QKTAYEISRDWSSDVCSSDLAAQRARAAAGAAERGDQRPGHRAVDLRDVSGDPGNLRRGQCAPAGTPGAGLGAEEDRRTRAGAEIGSGAGREKGWKQRGEEPV